MFKPHTMHQLMGDKKWQWIFIHHTAGRNNPKKTINHWANDQRGRVGTHYVIGGLSSTLNTSELTEDDSEWDGKILQAIADEYWAYHLGSVKSSKMHRGSISIELCSAGYLTQKNNKFYTWFGTEVHESQVCRLEHAYKGYQYYHKYSDAQIKSLEALLFLLSDKHGIDLKSGITSMLKNYSNSNKISHYTGVSHQHANIITTIFNYNEDACLGKIKGVLTHGQVRTGKSDVFPQKELIEMFQRL